MARQEVQVDVVISGWDDVRGWFFEWDFDHVISIGVPGSEVPDPIDVEDPRVLRLEFWDTHPFDDADDRGPQWEHAEALVAFCRDVLRVGGATIIHCAAGESRSSACALALLAIGYGPGREADAVADLGRLPGGDRARPNTMLVQHVDDLLEREGELERAMVERYHGGLL
jgi:predicted protein tyrosine phosphatase